jgi:hypothetical protein
MGRSIFATVLSLGLLGAGPAEAELDEFAMTNWEMVAAACAKYQQIFAAYGLETLFPDLEGQILGHARDQEASDDQLAVLERRFAEGQRAALDAGYAPGSRVDEVDKVRLEYLQGRADQVEDICTRSYQSLALMGAQPVDDGGLDEQAMKSWRTRAYRCGRNQEVYYSKGFEEELPNLMFETLGNARAQGASNRQVEELAQEYERGRVERREEMRKLEEKYGEIDWSDPNIYLLSGEYTERNIENVWRRCALNER